MTNLRVNADRLLSRLRELGSVGHDSRGRLARLAATDFDKAGRDLFVAWLNAAELDVIVDEVGNIFGVWKTSFPQADAALMIGSHIDSVVNAGIYDGCYGVLSGLEVIETLREAGYEPARPIVVAAFANEEGVRFPPDMMGSMVFAGALEASVALSTQSADGFTYGQELERIGYRGEKPASHLPIHRYVELHIEQGPVLEAEGKRIGVVTGVQGISWQRLVIHGTANHSGTTPMLMRKDAGYAAALIIAHMRELTRDGTGGMASAGSIRVEPDVINVIPARATITVDFRHPLSAGLALLETELAKHVTDVSEKEQVSIEVEQLVRLEPVQFDPVIRGLIQEVAVGQGHDPGHIVSGAGHDAQALARIAPSGMIFVPSHQGISHNPKEHTDEDQLIDGANVLLGVIVQLADQ